jgi:hypothetical protein
MADYMKMNNLGYIFFFIKYPQHSWIYMCNQNEFCGSQYLQYRQKAKSTTYELFFLQFLNQQSFICFADFILSIATFGF